MKLIETKNTINIEELEDQLMGLTPKHKKEISRIEKEFSCKIVSHTVKHNSVQYTYFYEIDFSAKEKLFIEIESGIRSGTILMSSEWN